MSQPRRSPRRASQRRRRGRASSKDEEDKSTSPLPSPGSWNVDRGRSRVRRTSNPFSEENLRRRGYHSLMSSFGKVFHVERRWKLIREMGSGAYGVVISAADEISGETVAIKLVTRVFDKVQLAKRALREITLLRHFAHHENITGLIDVDAVSPDFNEIYIFMEPMEADLHQIIKSGQTLTNEHVQYFLYQILRGMKYIHSASVIHRDLKPGNLLVNADCELKICDFGLSRGYDSVPDENTGFLTEYVATRWYRAPEIMLAFRRYNTAIDVWSIGCILAELLLGKTLFKGKDYVDQLNKVLDVLGTPDETVIRKIGSEKAQAYVRSLPWKKAVPFQDIILTADPLAMDLLKKMLAFDPDARITVPQALEHPWLAAYHDETDEPDCPEIFDRWRQIEELETIEQFREALWNEIEEYRREVRGIQIELTGLRKANGSTHPTSTQHNPQAAEPNLSIDQTINGHPIEPSVVVQAVTDAFRQNETIFEEVEDEVIRQLESASLTSANGATPHAEPQARPQPPTAPAPPPSSSFQQHSPERSLRPAAAQTPTDPVVTYARRSSILQPPSRQNSTFSSPVPPPHHLPAYIEGMLSGEPMSLGPGSIPFPTQGYIVPARSRTGSMAGGGEVHRRLLRTLSTVSIHESAEGLAGGLAGIAPIGKYIMDQNATEADAPPSEILKDYGIKESSKEGSPQTSPQSEGEKEVEQPKLDES